MGSQKFVTLRITRKLNPPLDIFRAYNELAIRFEILAAHTYIVDTYIVDIESILYGINVVNQIISIEKERGIKNIYVRLLENIFCDSSFMILFMKLFSI